MCLTGNGLESGELTEAGCSCNSSTVGDKAACMHSSATLLLVPLQLQRLRPTSLLELLNVVLQLPADFQVGNVRGRWLVSGWAARVCTPIPPVRHEDRKCKEVCV